MVKKIQHHYLLFIVTRLDAQLKKEEAERKAKKDNAKKKEKK